MIKTKRYIIEAFIIATVITGLLLVAMALMNTPINWIETASVYFSFACTWLCTRQVRFNYVLGVISTSLLVYTFWQAELFGSMALNIYLIPTVIIGWFMWGRDTSPKPVEHVKIRKIPLYGIFTAITWLGALYLITFFGGEMAALDGWLLVGTVLAQFLLDRKKIENWMIWVIVDAVSIYVYWQAGLYLLAAQFALFGANAVYAWFQWKKSMKADQGKVGADAEPDNGILPQPAAAVV